MADQTPAELAKKADDLQKQADAAKAASDAAAELAKHPRAPEVIVIDILHAIGDRLGNHPRLEKLLAELDAAVVRAAPPADAEKQAA